MSILLFLKKRSLLIFGNYGGQNWGDEAILSGILSDIPKDVFSLTVASSNPTHTKKMHQVNSVFLPPFGIMLQGIESKNELLLHRIHGIKNKIWKILFSGLIKHVFTGIDLRTIGRDMDNRHILGNGKFSRSMTGSSVHDHQDINHSDNGRRVLL